MKYFLIIILAFQLSGCNYAKKDNSNVFYYNLYDSKDSMLTKNIYALKSMKLKTFDSINLYEKGKLILNFKQTFSKEKGIFIHCNNQSFLTHPINNKNIGVNKCSLQEPFLNRKITFINSKEYEIKGKHYKLYHYSEESDSHTSFDSYLLENVGFISYYNFDNDNYILMDSTNIKSIDLKDITNTLIKDTTFFARYTVAKLFPKYYRKPNNKNSL